MRIHILIGAVEQHALCTPILRQIRVKSLPLCTVRARWQHWREEVQWHTIANQRWRSCCDFHLHRSAIPFDLPIKKAERALAIGLRCRRGCRLTLRHAPDREPWTERREDLFQATLYGPNNPSPEMNNYHHQQRPRRGVSRNFTYVSPCGKYMIFLLNFLFWVSQRRGFRVASKSCTFCHRCGLTLSNQGRSVNWVEPFSGKALDTAKLSFSMPPGLEELPNQPRMPNFH
jgi:hypothetical protein